MHVHILSGSRTGPARWEQVSLHRKLCGIERGQLCPSASPAANAVTGSNAACRGQVPPKRLLAVDEHRESGGFPAKAVVMPAATLFGLQTLPLVDCTRSR